MDCQITPEICTVINHTINELFYKIGLPFFIVILCVIFLLHLGIRRHFSKKFEGYKSNLEKVRAKDISIWTQQKELMFDFVQFLEEDFFSNKDINDSDIEKSAIAKKDMFKKLNSYYGRLYLVMESDILKKINTYIQGATSPVQRFYLYKELRKQLMIIVHKDFSDNDCPYIEGKSAAVLAISKAGAQYKTKDFNEVKEAYPFVEECEGGAYKALPFFAEDEEKSLNHKIQ